jgi:hypothetical protein
MLLLCSLGTWIGTKDLLLDYLEFSRLKAAENVAKGCAKMTLVSEATG